MTTYYVSALTGNDANSGLSTSAAFLTISKAITVVRAGDTVNVMNGTYSEDVWFNGKNGASGNVITFQNYVGHTPILDGLAEGNSNSGYPTRGSIETNLTVPTTGFFKNGDPMTDYQKTFAGRGAKYTGLVQIDNSSYIVWDGIDVIRSLGRGFSIGNSSYITIKNIDMTEHRNAAVVTEYSSDNITIQDCYIHLAMNNAPFRRTSEQLDWPAAISIVKSTNCTVDGVELSQSWGETITIDNRGENITNGHTVKDCVMYDGMYSIYIHGVKNVTVERCYIYRSATTPNSYNSDGINIAVSEPIFANAGVENITVRNCIIANTRSHGINLAGGSRGAEVKNVTIVNNTIINIEGPAINTWSTVNAKSLVFKNNIVFQTGSNARTNTNFLSTTEVDADYNYWNSQPTQTHFQGANDINSATSPIVNYQHNPAAGEHDANNYRLLSTATAIDAADDLSADFTDDYFEATRGGWDIGAHEYDGFGAVTATAGVSQNTGVVSVTEFDFTGSAAGGTGPYTYAWDFGDGTTSTDQNPQNKIYQSTGTFVATLTVTDDNDITDTDTETITVTTQGTSGGSDGAVNGEVVAFDAGDASFAVSGTPVGIVFFGSGATTDNTVTANAQLAAGVWASNAQYCYGTNTLDANTNDYKSYSRQVTDKALVWINNSTGAEVYSGVVSSVTASAVNMTWSGTATAYKCYALVLYGSGLTATTGTSTLGTSGSTTTVSQNRNLLIVPTVVRSNNIAGGNQEINLGMAVNGGNQFLVAHGVSGLQSGNTLSKAFIRDGHIAERVWFNSGVYATAAFGASDFRFTVAGGDMNQAIIWLAVLVSDASLYLSDFSTPTDTNKLTYTDAGFDAGFVLGATTLLTATDASGDDFYSEGERASSIAFFAGDGTATQSIGIGNQDGAATSVAKSFADDKVVVLDKDGTVEDTGAVGMETGGWSITLATAGGTARKGVALIVESTTAAAGPTADFTWYVTRNGVRVYPDTDAPEAGETVQFVNLSNDNDGDSDPLDEISSHSWDVTGNGTEDYDDQDPTHSYTNPGFYSVSLTVANDNILLETGDNLLLETGNLVLKDADGNTNTITKTIEIQAEEPTASFVAADTTVSEGTAVELDASGSDAGSYTLNKYLWTFRKNAPLSTIVDDLVFRPGSEIPENTFRQETTASDLDIILDPGKWSISLQVGDTSANAWSDTETKDYYVAVTFPLAVDFYEAGGGGTHPTSYEATFYALVNTDDAGATYEWDFGDGSSSTGAGLTETTHEYTSVGSYDVALTVTLPAPNDASTDTTTKTDFITIVAAPTVPYTNAQLVALRADVLEHAGYMGTGTWAVNGSHANVWEMTLTRKWAEAVTVVVVKNGERMTMVADAAAVQSAGAGNAYASYVQATGALTLGVYAASDPTDGSDEYYFLVEKQYDLQDEFYTPLAAGSVDGTDAEPGPGTRDVPADVGSGIAITSGYLSAVGTGNWGETRFAYEESISREAGLMLIGSITPLTNLTTRTAFGFANDPAVTIANFNSLGFYIYSGALTVRGTSDSNSPAVFTPSLSTAYPFAVIARDGSFYYFIRDSGDWKLLYAAGDDTYTTLYTGFTTRNTAERRFEYWRIPTARWLPVPLASDGFGSTFGTTDGAGHAETSGLGSGGDGLTWTQQSGTWSSAAGAASCDGAGIATVTTTTADMLVDIDLTRDSGNLGIVARYTDANNYLRAYHDGTNAKLDEVVSGTPANLISAAATYAAGATLRLITDDTSARLYYNDALVGTTSGIDAGLTATNAGLYTSAATNAFDNFVVYARGTGGEHNIGLLHYAESPSRALLETGYAILKESGDYLLLED